MYYAFAEGSVDVYTRRVILALRSLRHDVIKWPDAEERVILSRVMEDKTGIPGMILSIDGTLFVLAEKPSHFGELYYTRKENYAINGFTIVDYNKRYVKTRCFAWWMHDEI